MGALTSVPISPLDTERFQTVLDAETYERFVDAIGRSRTALEGRRVWNVNSTARGGGVAEMLVSLLAYAQGAGIDARWEVVSGNPDFFTLTKRIHNNLHGAEGDGGELGEAEHEIYEDALAPNAEEFAALVEPTDVVILHDPQTAGLIPKLKPTGVPIIWRCHVGVDMPNELSRRAWNFLIPYVDQADLHIFSREGFAWEGLDATRGAIIAPSIDAFSPKNQELSDDAVSAILGAAGLGNHDANGAEPIFRRENGDEARVERTADVFEEAPLRGDEPIVLQISRWDRLKDPIGVIEGFAKYVAPHTDAHLVYAGPAVAAVSDDPEGKEVLEEAQRHWQELPDDVRGRVHLAALPMEDGEENAAIVNALQRRAAVVVQKSIAEGFGLTVAEAMWKGRPVVASKIGGIQDQVVDGVSGVLIPDARDLEAYGKAVSTLLTQPKQAAAMGTEAARRVRAKFLGVRSLMEYFDLIAPLLRPR